MEKKIKNFSSRKQEGESQLADKIRDLTNGLFYISETDSPVGLFTGSRAAVVNGREMLKQTGGSKNQSIKEISFEIFFENLTKIKDWYGDREKETAARWAKLKDLLESNLSEASVFRIGTIQIDIYVVGLNEEGRLAGIQTKAVET